MKQSGLWYQTILLFPLLGELLLLVINLVRQDARSICFWTAQSEIPSSDCQEDHNSKLLCSSCSDEWYTYHVVIIKFEGVSSQHQFTGCSDSAGEVQEPERREQDKSSITTLDFLRTDLTSQEQPVVHQSPLKNPQHTVLWREESAEELSNADSSSIHNLQHTIWNTTASSGCSRTRNTCLPEGVWERPLRCLKNWRFCCMGSNQAGSSNYTQEL